MVTKETINGVEIRKTDQASSWRLVYNEGESWALLFESDGSTRSESVIEIVDDEAAGLARIKELGLNRVEHG